MNAVTTGGVEQVTIRVLPDGRVNGRDAATYLGKAEKTLSQWRWENRGPKPMKVGGRIFYHIDELRRFVSGEAA